jgi:hypothetical protein
MNYLAENSLPIWVAGAVLLTMAGVVYWQLRSGAALAAMAVIAAATGALLAVEHFVVTPREAVERTLYEMADVVEANDVSGALTYVAPGASTIRSDIETLMPQVRIEKANIMGTPLVNVDLAAKPPTATVTCRGFVYGTHKRNGMTGGEPVELVLTFVQEGDRWLVQDYSSPRDWRKAVAGGRNSGVARP